ncbi:MULTISPECIES: hypothetical protein [Paenibacillus]|uniref:Helix-turn-helix conjugative transposon-like domain-containing protein n=1 Tax=Paenibacillus helianthi TaxID=1349432 RepID=A0ABX3ERP1_9BACL|nr:MULTISPECIES: hypothetical protein [Paenibacillus]OKP82174.1 hypothetical protein A3848_29630 [Paenibacillus sp. P32E]OKP87037.1 hypothetical protein A3844_11100 [Paenibacillus helianthi]OKP89022.1 hypothetical protein A3842_04865 [Paenibacillus sp. P3E]OKP99275.1 hypothetical protein A3849_06290 [Paenibacillus sp. P46E]
MEEENDSGIKSEDEFLGLLERLQKDNDESATLALLKFFEKDMVRLTRVLRMPKEDAIQSMKVELLECLKRKNG